MGQLNIKDDRLIAETKALADLLGTSATDAVRQAVHEKLERARREREDTRQRKFEAIMAIADSASRLVPPGVTSDHADLYDEHGLPR